MVVRVGSMYGGDCECEYYKEGERIHIDPDALSVVYGILEDEDDDEAIDGREGELSKSFDYELHDGQLCAIVDGEFVPCEDDYKFECYLRRREENGSASVCNGIDDMDGESSIERDEGLESLGQELNDAIRAKDWAREEKVQRKIFEYNSTRYRMGSGDGALGLATAYYNGAGIDRDLRKSWEMFKEAERLGCRTASLVRLSYFGNESSPDRLIAEDRRREELEKQKPEWMRRKPRRC